MHKNLQFINLMKRQRGRYRHRYDDNTEMYLKGLENEVCSGMWSLGTGSSDGLL
jgi:hypothetical protein